MSTNNKNKGDKPKHNSVPRAYHFLGGLYMPKGDVVEDIGGYTNAINWWNRQYAVATESIAHISANLDAGRGDDLESSCDLDAAFETRKIAMDSIHKYAVKLAELSKFPETK